MSVNPGFGGQSFIDSALRKIEKLAQAPDRPPPGATSAWKWTAASRPTTSARAADAGADTFVAGSAIFGQPDYVKAIAALRVALGVESCFAAADDRLQRAA